jgi:hypothetical protein
LFGVLHPQGTRRTGVGPRACYRWLTRDYPPVFADLPERTGLFRLFATHRTWADEFLADPTLRGGADSSGIERVHPMRQGRSARHIGCKGTSNQRWIVGVTRAYIVNHHGVVVAWDGAAANVYAAVVHPVIADFPHDMVVFTDMGVHATRGDPLNMQACARNTGNVRMVVETVVAMRTRVCYLKTISQRRWPYVLARLRCTLALCNVLVQWHGVPVDEDGTIRLSMAPFSV